MKNTGSTPYVSSSGFIIFNVGLRDWRHFSLKRVLIMVFVPEEIKPDRPKVEQGTRLIVVGLIVFLVVCLLAAGVWYFYIRPEQAAKKREAPPAPGVPV